MAVSCWLCLFQMTWQSWQAPVPNPHPLLLPWELCFPFILILSPSFFPFFIFYPSFVKRKSPTDAPTCRHPPILVVWPPVHRYCNSWFHPIFLPFRTSPAQSLALHSPHCSRQYLRIILNPLFTLILIIQSIFKSYWFFLRNIAQV